MLSHLLLVLLPIYVGPLLAVVLIGAIALFRQGRRMAADLFGRNRR